MLATRAALAAGANSTGPLASAIASLSGNATTLAAASFDAMAILDDGASSSPLSENLTTLLAEAVGTHSSAEAAVDAAATAAPPPSPTLSSSSSSSSTSSSSANIAYVSAVAVAAAGALIIADAAISLLLGLGLHWQLVGGGARCIGQLTVLGALLGPIFRSKAPPLVAAYAAFMLVVGSSEAASRPAYSYRGMTKHVVCSLGAASTAFLGYSLAVAVRPRPWWDPQYSIPTLGLMLGNAISGVAVGLGALLEDFAANGDRIELLLCLGASRWEATRGAVSRAVRLALTPLLNQLNVVGLVVRLVFSFLKFLLFLFSNEKRESERGGDKISLFFFVCLFVSRPPPPKKKTPPLITKTVDPGNDDGTDDRRRGPVAGREVPNDRDVSGFLGDRERGDEHRLARVGDSG